jgi:hypothetical protein
MQSFPNSAFGKFLRTHSNLSNFAALMKKLVGFVLLAVVALIGHSQVYLLSLDGTSSWSTATGSFYSAELLLNDGASVSTHPISGACEDQELPVPEKEEKEESDPEPILQEFHVFSSRVQIADAPHPSYLNTSSKLYLLQGVLRI